MQGGLAAGSRDRAMQFEISYGKRRVPVYRTKATPLAGVRAIPESPFTGRPNDLLAAEVDVEVYGDDFLPSYTVGDNSMIVATDSMKNFVIRESLAYDGATLEGLCAFLGARFASEYSQLHDLRITGRELPFTGYVVGSDGGFAPSGNLHVSQRGDYGEATTRLHRTSDGSLAITDHQCWRRDVHLMKLTGSAFTAFVRDGYTTLPERKDRPLYVFMEVGWRYANPSDMTGDDVSRFVPSEQVRDICATIFADLVSESIQQLVYEMGNRILERFPQLSEIEFTATNRTRDPFGERDGGAKVYSDPFPAFGNIYLKMSR
jgi:urate oxidase